MIWRKRKGLKKTKNVLLGVEMWLSRVAASFHGDEGLV